FLPSPPMRGVYGLRQASRRACVVVNEIAVGWAKRSVPTAAWARRVPRLCPRYGSVIVSPSMPPSRPVDRLAPDFQFQPLVLRRPRGVGRGAEPRRNRVERLAVACVEAGVGELLLRGADLRLQRRDLARQRLQRVFLVEAQPALARLCLRPRGGRCRLRVA